MKVKIFSYMIQVYDVCEFKNIYNGFTEFPLESPFYSYILKGDNQRSLTLL